ncbi:YqgE like protein [Rodentibacter pneumotropicus]|uniref:YqgE like protein n=1 Tax=Rodentibacter pneumotropicus TaxID=758 RepID=A0A3S4UC11_9PAST|nr:YqgE like protein [Rodentibacter pneumotropicus]
MGVVINQPTDLSIAELYSKLNFMMKMTALLMMQWW